MAAIQIYKREDLRDYAARASIQGYTTQVLRSAQEGKTWHLIELKQNTVQVLDLNTRTVRKQPTKDEIIPVLQRVFPDCRVEYVEWFETSSGTKQFKKGILVDWS